MRLDNYPTRRDPQGRFIDRVEPTAYRRAAELDFDLYCNNGYVVVKQFFDYDDIMLLLKCSDNPGGLITKEPDINATRSITGVHKLHPFEAISKMKRLVDMVKRLLGSDIYIHQSRINYKASIGSNGWHWHSDFETWHAQDGMPSMRCLTAMIPLTYNSYSNGPLMVIPGSHKLFYSCKKEGVHSAQENFADQKEGLPDINAINHFFSLAGNNADVIRCEPTDLVLFDCNIIHGSTQNMTPNPRTNLFIVYNSIHNQLEQPFSVGECRPEEMGSRSEIEIL